MTSLNQRIQEFYDSATNLWESRWGEHLHHGYYAEPQKWQSKNPQQAQLDLITEILAWSEVASTPPHKILDAGCGIGGTSLYFAREFSAQVIGVTLSPQQAKRATEKAREHKLSDRLSFQVADAQAMPFADQSFDLVWSLESGEHMADKQKFLQECFRVLKPQGRLVLATWCHRPTQLQPLSQYEQEMLERIYRVYCLPFVVSVPDYQAIAARCGFREIRTADWSEQVAPFWLAVWDAVRSPSAIWDIFRYGWHTINGALAVRLMIRGYACGLLKFGLLTAKK